MNALLRILAWVFAVALVLAPVAAVLNGWIGGGRWPMRHLVVTGEFRQVSDARVRSEVLPLVQDAVDALPWVERAEVRKHWPDVLEVRIVEHRPFARWGAARLLSEHGRLFPVGKLRVPAGLPLLDGPEGRVPEVVALYNQAREQLAGAGGVLGVAIDPRGSWSITLADGTRVVLGRNDPGTRLARFAPMLPQLVAQNPQRRLVRADLRYTNGFALTWAKAESPTPNHGSNT